VLNPSAPPASIGVAMSAKVRRNPKYVVLHKYLVRTKPNGLIRANRGVSRPRIREALCKTGVSPLPGGWQTHYRKILDFRICTRFSKASKPFFGSPLLPGPVVALRLGAVVPRHVLPPSLAEAWRPTSRSCCRTASWRCRPTSCPNSRLLLKLPH
jgi:hypothetical protein